MANLIFDTEYDQHETEQPKRKRENKRRWREIEKFKEKRRLSRELARNHTAYYDFLEEF